MLVTQKEQSLPHIHVCNSQSLDWANTQLMLVNTFERTYVRMSVGKSALPYRHSTGRSFARRNFIFGT